MGSPRIGGRACLSRHVRRVARPAPRLSRWRRCSTAGNALRHLRDHGPPRGLETRVGVARRGTTAARTHARPRPRGCGRPRSSEIGIVSVIRLRHLQSWPTRHWSWRLLFHGRKQTVACGLTGRQTRLDQGRRTGARRCVTAAASRHLHPGLSRWQPLFRGRKRAAAGLSLRAACRSAA